MGFELQVKAPNNQTRREPLEGDSLVLGRAHSNDLCFPDDASLSRKHLRLDRAEDGWTVTDLGSKNGTLLNGSRITGRERFNPGDRVSAGQILMTLVDTEMNTAESVIFVPESGPELHPSATVMTSLEGLLSSSESTTPSARPQQPVDPSRAAFEHPVVRALIRAGRELAGHQPLEDLFQLILNLSIEAVGAERGVLMTLEGEQLIPRSVHGEGFRISTTVRDRVLKEKTSLLVRDIAQEHALREQLSISEQQIHSLMAVPLQTENRVIGLVYVDSRLFIREFTSDDLNLLTVLTNVAAIRIEHQRLQAVQHDAEIRARDLEQAAEIQRSILPKSPPNAEGLDVAGHNAPSRTVGGDYYDFITYPDGRMTVVLGDVAGKGMSAALLMSNLQARVQILAETPVDLAPLMSRLDRSLSVNCPANRFITMFMCRIDPSSGEIVYCNAGHNPAFLVRADGSVQELKSMGTVLGILPDLGYDQGQETLRDGDLIAIYSDGVTEAHDPSDEEFGESRLADLLALHRESSAEEIIELVLSAVDEWTDLAPPDDDVTLVVIRRTC